MLYSYFETSQIITLIVSGLLLLLSVILFKKSSNSSMLLLFLGTLCLGYFVASLDPFLNLWDEQYHALVAKNLLSNPLKPTLYSNPLLHFDYRNWTANNVWLHKQPLFLWQIALSLKLFGISELSVRIPSIIMHAFIPVFIYRIGSITINKNSAYYGALFFATAYFPLELIVGGYSTDHNDIAFLFYITASLWSWFEYSQSNKTYWLVLIGIFSGCAVLVKWLMGLLIYVVWIISKLVWGLSGKFKIKSYLPILYSGSVSISVFLPWVLYARIKYPKEFLYEYALNGKHFFEVIEGHSKGFFYYFTNGLMELYGTGDAIPAIVLAGIVIMLIKVINNKYRIFIMITIIFVYLFYTAAATKMVGFVLIVAPFIYLGIGTLVNETLIIIRKKIRYPLIVAVLGIVIPISIAFTALNLSRIYNFHTMNKPHNNRNRLGELTEMKFIKSLKEELPDTNYVIFNAGIIVNGHIPIMFYTNHIAYNFIPSQSQIIEIRKQNKKIAIVNINTLPDYITSDDKIKMLNVEKLE